MKFLQKKPIDMNGGETIVYSLAVGGAITAASLAVGAVTWLACESIDRLLRKRKEKEEKEKEAKEKEIDIPCHDL